MSFANLKRNRGQIDKLVEAAKSSSSGQKSYGDDRFWKPTVDASNNGYAVIRFLPASEGSDIPWIEYWDHGFKGPTGKWYIEKSLTSIGQQDPVGELNSRLWNVSEDDNSPERRQARKQKRRHHYVSNIMVVNDPGNPANEGKVFFFQYGKKIHDKLLDALQPQFADEKPMDPFDFWNGSDFKLKIRDVEGYRNYDKSEFSAKSEVAGGDEEQLEKIYNSLHDLRTLVDPKEFKSYSELQAKLMSVLGESASYGAPKMADEKKMGSESKPYETRRQEPKSEPELSASEVSNSVDEDDTMSYFANLVNDD
jgi:hypothetical protein